MENKKDKLVEWLIEEIEMSKRYANECANCIAEWNQRYVMR